MGRVSKAEAAAVLVLRNHSGRVADAGASWRRESVMKKGLGWLAARA